MALFAQKIVAWVSNARGRIGQPDGLTAAERRAIAGALPALTHLAELGRAADR